MIDRASIFWRINNVSLGKRFSVGLLVFIVLSQVSRLSSGFENGPVLCPFRFFTHLPCPFCGTTRSIGRIFLGDFREALFLNPLGYIFVMGILITIISPKTLNSLSKSISSKWWNLETSHQYLLLVAVFILTWLANLPRLI